MSPLIPDMLWCPRVGRSGSKDDVCWLVGWQHVVLGKVLFGMEVVFKIEVEGTTSGVPRSKVVIADKGELPL
ncbi:hypothetical protein RHMOL_Rhmol08G0282700 [Rhododendron molle]|uniref:Uncharacterized protein n=1 Tax=Rhododendron molle TaxID=49168 RepID=A0ACC0MTN4_RHOML|nr:hypothetical protein RHMOL_Rhmol08G0282700 [Rhododendron molle]